MYPSTLMQHIEHANLDNGLIIGGEQRVGVQTVALHLAVPAGIATNDNDGESAVLAELVQRGASGLSALEHQHALERLGVRKHVSCGKEFIFVSAVMLASKLDAAFPLIYSIFSRCIPSSNAIAKRPFLSNLCKETPARCTTKSSHCNCFMQRMFICNVWRISSNANVHL